MSEHFLSNKYSWFINILLFIFPIVINSQNVVGDLILFILTVTGLFVTFFYKISPFSVKELRIFNWLTLSYFAVICVSILFSGKALELAHFISRELYFLFAPFVALAIFKAKVNISVVLYGVKVGLIVLAAMVYFNVGSFDVRYSGSLNADPYGLVAAIMTLLSISRVLKEDTVNKVFTFISFFSGILVTISSGTRSAWIVFCISILAYMWIAYKNTGFKNILKIIMVFVVFILAIGSFFNFNNMENRILSSGKQAIAWHSGEDVSSSVGVRLEMWKSSIKYLVHNPSVFGVGYRNNINIKISKYSDPISQQQISRYNHVHNTYLNHLIAEGIIGLVAVLSLLLLPFKLFYVNIARSTYAVMGVILSSSFVVYGIANKLFGDVHINAFYILFMSLLLPKVKRKRVN